MSRAAKASRDRGRAANELILREIRNHNFARYSDEELRAALARVRDIHRPGQSGRDPPSSVRHSG